MILENSWRGCVYHLFIHSGVTMADQKAIYFFNFFTFIYLYLCARTTIHM